MEEAECFEALKQNLLPSATQFASELNITKEDLESMTGVGIHDNEEFENARWVDAFRNNYRLLNNSIFKYILSMRSCYWLDCSYY